MKEYNGYERPEFTPGKIMSLRDDEVFVFGSNEAGQHAGGAARIAYERFGAVLGQGVGLQGQSYAIPTMGDGIESIIPFVNEFVDFAKENPQYYFYVTKIGCGIAGYKVSEIAPMFVQAKDLPNVSLPEEFYPYI